MPKFGFDISEVEANEPINYDPLPKGEYTLRGIEAELKDTKNNAGSYIAVKYEAVSYTHLTLPTKRIV